MCQHFKKEKLFKSLSLWTPYICRTPNNIICDVYLGAVCNGMFLPLFRLRSRFQSVVQATWHFKMGTPSFYIAQYLNDPFYLEQSKLLSILTCLSVYVNLFCSFKSLLDVGYWYEILNWPCTMHYSVHKRIIYFPINWEKKIALRHFS